MKNLRNKFAPPTADLVQKYLDSAWDKVVAVYNQLDDIEMLAATDLSQLVTDAELVDAINAASLAVLRYQGPYDASTNSPNIENPTPNNIEVGHVYVVTADGDFHGEGVHAGDMLIAEVTSPTDINGWTVLEGNLDPSAYVLVADLDTAAYTPVEDYATAAQGALADAVDQRAYRKSNLTAAVDPTVADDANSGYAPYSVWVNLTDDKLFFCLDAAVGAAVWQEVGAGGGGGLTNYILNTNGHITSASEELCVNSSGGSFSVTLNATPSVGEVVLVRDIASSCGANPVTINRNGKNIRGLAENAVLDVDNGIFWMIFDGVDWEFTPIVVGNAVSKSELDAAVETATTQYKGANSQIGVSYTLVGADAGKVIDMDNAAANTVEIPLNATVAFPINTRIDVYQHGAGQTSITGAVGVTLNGEVKVPAQYGMVSLWKRGTDEWVIVGGIA